MKFPVSSRGVGTPIHARCRFGTPRAPCSREKKRTVHSAWIWRRRSSRCFKFGQKAVSERRIRTCETRRRRSAEEHDEGERLHLAETCKTAPCLNSTRDQCARSRGLDGRAGTQFSRGRDDGRRTDENWRVTTLRTSGRDLTVNSLNRAEPEPDRARDGAGTTPPLERCFSFRLRRRRAASRCSRDACATWTMSGWSRKKRMIRGDVQNIFAVWKALTSPICGDESSIVAWKRVILTPLLRSPRASAAKKTLLVAHEWDDLDWRRRSS